MLGAKVAAQLPFCLYPRYSLMRFWLTPHSSLPTQEFVSVCFSSDGKYVAAQGGAPDWTISLWIWEKSKLVASARTVGHPGASVTQCLVHPGAV